MADMFDEALQTLSGGPSDTYVAPKADMHDEAVARLRPQAVTDQLTGPTRENAKGYQREVPDWNLAKAIANGMAQGYLPQMLAVGRAGGLDEGGTSADPAFQSKYEQAVKDLQGSRESYGRENSGKALVGEMGGSLATLVPAMAAGAGALGAGARTLPALNGITDFLSGASKIPYLSAASQAVRGGTEGVVSGVGSSGLSDKPLKEQAETGGLLGMLLGPLGGYFGNMLGSHVNKTSAETAQALLDQGVALRAGQVPGSGKVAQGLDKVFGGGNAEQRADFGEKLTGFAGLPEKEVSQGWVAKNDQRVGKVMNDIQSVYSIPQLEPGLLHDLSTVRSDAISNMSVENAQKVSDFVRKIEDNTFSDMNGATYKNITQKGGILDNMSKDKDIASAVPKIREALDDAWGRALPADKKAAWDQARKEYKVTRVIDDSMGASGAAEGVYNPKKLLKAVEDRYGNVENAGELGLLARGGQFLEPPGAAPASAKHGAVKTVGGLALAGMAGAAASEGSKAITHWGPEAIAALSQHPESFALPLTLAAGLYGGAKAANSALNSPRATQYMLDVARGIRAPMLRGNNPLVPFAVEGYNRQ
jgi:hypothetical protein